MMSASLPILCDAGLRLAWLTEFYMSRVELEAVRLRLPRERESLHGVAYEAYPEGSESNLIFVSGCRHAYFKKSKATARPGSLVPFPQKDRPVWMRVVSRHSWRCIHLNERKNVRAAGGQYRSRLASRSRRSPESVHKC